MSNGVSMNQSAPWCTAPKKTDRWLWMEEHEHSGCGRTEESRETGILSKASSHRKWQNIAPGGRPLRQGKA